MTAKTLKNYIHEYSIRNKKVDCSDVYSVTNSEGFVSSIEYFSKEVFSKDLSNYKIVYKNSLAFNPSRINVGSVAVQNVMDKVIVSPLYTVFTVDEKFLLPDYLNYFLHSNLGLQQINNLTTGSVRDTLKYSALCDITLNIPSIEQQKNYLRRLRLLDYLIGNHNNLLKDFDTLIKSQFIEMFGDVIHNNKAWPVRKFSDITSSRLGKMLDTKKQTGKECYPYLANFNVQWFRFNLENLNKMDFDEADRIEFKLCDGDLLVCEGGEIGRCAVWHNELQPCFFQKAVHRVRCNQQIIHQDYLAWWFRYICAHGGFAKIVGAKSTIAHLTGVKLKQLIVTVPPIELQNKFADFVAQVNKSKLAIQQSLNELETLKKSLMQEYFG